MKKLLLLLICLLLAGVLAACAGKNANMLSQGDYYSDFTAESREDFNGYYKITARQSWNLRRS